MNSSYYLRHLIANIKVLWYDTVILGRSHPGLDPGSTTYFCEAEIILWIPDQVRNDSFLDPGSSPG